MTQASEPQKKLRIFDFGYGAKWKTRSWKTWQFDHNAFRENSEVFSSELSVLSIVQNGKLKSWKTSEKYSSSFPRTPSFWPRRFATYLFNRLSTSKVSLVLHYGSLEQCKVCFNISLSSLHIVQPKSVEYLSLKLTLISKPPRLTLDILDNLV